jgi:hypothetical protein
MKTKQVQIDPRLERDALRLLCSVLIQPVTRVELTRLLDVSLFQETMHRVLFEEIRSIGAVSSPKLRELLPGRITTRGFPDFDLTEFLSPDFVSAAEIEKLFASVLGMIEFRHREDEQILEN